MANNKKNSCCNDANWETFNKALSFLFIVLALVVAIVVAVKNPNSILRYDIRATGEQVDGGTGEAGAQLFGPLALDSNDIRMTYEFRTLNMADATAIHLKGPIVVGTNNGPIAAVLCGGPSPLPACDTSMPGEIPLTVVKEVWDGISPTAQSMEVLIRTIRKNPHLYYLEALNANGGVRAPLGSISGIP